MASSWPGKRCKSIGDLPDALLPSAGLFGRLRDRVKSSWALLPSRRRPSAVDCETHPMLPKKPAVETPAPRKTSVKEELVALKAAITRKLSLLPPCSPTLSSSSASSIDQYPEMSIDSQDDDGPGFPDFFIVDRSMLRQPI
ncbi:unnamed protein product, partial [Mesorhabditis spiculigera]